MILRGNAKQDIFLEEQDNCKFMKEIYNTKEKYEYELYAYCLMTNHVHLIIHDKNDKLSKIIQSLTISYSAYWNKKYERVGHVFQNRFLSKNVENEKYLRTLCRYIHQNPCKSGIGEMEEYAWSSYQEYLKESQMIETKQILRLFGKERTEAISNFISFHKVNQKQEDIREFIEYEMVERLNNEQARKYMEEVLQLKNIKEIAEYSVKKRNEYLKKLKGMEGISKIQITRITGLSRKMIEKAIKEKEE